LAQQKGLFLALSAKTGRVLWRKNTGRCSASSPTIHDHVVYQSWMSFVNCPQGQAGATGYLAAWNYRTGHTLWRHRGAPIESSPLLVGHTLYYGAWDNRVHAIDARNGHERWSFEGDGQMNTAAAYWNHTIYIASYGGTVYALNARTCRQRWSSA